MKSIPHGCPAPVGALHWGSATRFRSGSSLAVSLACFLLLVFFPTGQRAHGANLKKVFGVGDPVEGLAGITVQLVTHAKLTGDGRVVAVVWLQGPGVVADNREAIVSAVPGGPVQLWGRAGDPALGDGVPGGSTIANFAATNSSVPLVASDTGVMARSVEINVPGAAFKARAVVAGGMGSLRVEVYDEKPWPAFGLGVKLRAQGDPGVSRSGEIAYLTSSSGGGTYAVWKGQPGTVALVAREDVAYDGLPGWGMFEYLLQPAINETGELSFYGQLRKDFPPFPQPPVVSDANRDRLWKGGPPFVELLNSSSEIAGGGTLGGALQAWASSGPWVFFTATHRQPARSDTVVAVVQAGAPPQIVMHPQREAPDAAGGSIGPFSFVSHLDTTVVPSGVIVTNQRLLIQGAVDTTNDQGIWRWDGSVLRLLAREGAEVPGLPGRHWSPLRNGIALLSGIGVFSAFVPEQGSPTNPTKRNWTGIWWGESAGTLALLLEDGGPIDLGGGVLGTNRSFERVRSANDTHLLVEAEYTIDGSSFVRGLALLDPAAPPPNGALGGSVRLDYDQDGNLADTEDLPVAGILCELLARDAAGNPFGPVLQTSISADNGTYGYAEVPPGAYVVRATLGAGQQGLGMRWTSPRPLLVGSASVFRNADVTGVAAGTLDFLLTTAIRPDSFADESDGNVGPGRQSLREALDRAALWSRLFFEDVVVDLLPGTYLLDTPLIFESAGGVARKVTLRAPATRPLSTVLDGQQKTRIVEIRSGGWVKAEWVQFQSGKSDDDGGAVRQEGLSFEAVQCAFAGCSAFTKGGAVANLAGTVTFRSCAFSGNSSAHVGGALSCAGSAGTNVTVEDSLFLGNSADERGGAIAVEGGGLQLRRSSVIKNTAMLEGEGLIVFPGAQSPFLHSCLVQGGEGSILSGGYNLIVKRAGLAVTAQNGDLFDLDPRVSDGGLILPDSPVINAGDPLFVLATMPVDLLGNPRVAGGRIDIGALEFQGTPNPLAGGKVRLDYDQDGDLADPATEDLPVPGLVFELLARDAAGNPTGPVLKTSISDANGAYGFENVSPGAYVVRAMLDADQQAKGLSWTSPGVTTASVSRRLDLPGADAAKLDFLATSALRPDDYGPGPENVYPDLSDGDVRIGRQSLREALHRASRISRLRDAKISVDLSPGRYSLMTPLVIDPETRIGLRGEASHPIRTRLDGQGNTRILEIKPGGELNLEWVELRNGRSTEETGAGGAVRNEGEFNAQSCGVRLSISATDGGGLANATGSISRLFSCYFGDNEATHNGGAVWCAAQLNPQDNRTGVGLIDTVLFLNKAGGRGGAVATEGGGIALERASVVWNDARLEGGGLMVFGGSTTARNSLFGGNTVSDAAIGEDGSGSIHSDGYNWFEAPGDLVFSATSASTDQRGRLTLMAYRNIRLSPDSLAINAGDPAVVAGGPGVPSEDALGNPRITGGRIDIGAIEFQGSPTEWALVFFGEAVASNPALAETVHGPSADPDQDGATNLQERALGGNPKTSSQTRADGTSMLPQIVRTAGAAVGGTREARDGKEEPLAFVFALDERYTDLRYTVQTSGDEASRGPTPLPTSLSARAWATATNPPRAASRLPARPPCSSIGIPSPKP